MPDFSTRSNEKEIMDDLQLGGSEMDRTLRELEIINQWLGGNYVTTNGIGKLLKHTPHKQITIADLGCGGGDMLKLIAKWGRNKGYDLRLIGVDANSHIIEYAKHNCSEYPEISFLKADIFSEEFSIKMFDIITNTLFTHHFSSVELTSMYSQWIRQASLGIVINDLHRHPLAYHSIKMLTQAFSKSNMVKNDAPISVLRSFKKRELRNILESARVEHYDLNWMWAFRWQLVIRAQA